MNCKDYYITRGKQMALGDRKDGKLLRDLDAMHLMMPCIFPSRCDNEAFVSETIDLTELDKFLEEKNSTNPEYAYKLFQVIVSAILKTIILRPKMNRFIANKNFYQRTEYSASFVIKKQFTDSSEEGIAVIRATENDNLDSIRDKMYKKIMPCKRSEVSGGTEGAMNIIKKLPRFLMKFLYWTFYKLDEHGLVPDSLLSDDPYHASVILSNLGSIKLHSGYHHLTNWGTTSVFVVVGEKKKRPFYNEDGSFEMRESVDIGMTVDERIADGYYFAKTIKMLKGFIENPRELEEAFGGGNN